MQTYRGIPDRCAPAAEQPTFAKGPQPLRVVRLIADRVDAGHDEEQARAVPDTSPVSMFKDRVKKRKRTKSAIARALAILDWWPGERGKGKVS